VFLLRSFNCVRSFHFHHISSLFLFTPISLGKYLWYHVWSRFEVNIFLHLKFNVTYHSIFIFSCCTALLYQCIMLWSSPCSIFWAQFIQFYTTLIFFFYLNALSCLIPVTFSNLFLFYPLQTFSPGPVSRLSSCNTWTLDISSFTSPLHYTALSDLTDSYNDYIDVFALTETWIANKTTSA